MIVGIAVDTTVDSKEASAVTRMSAIVTMRRRFGSKRGADMGAREYRVSACASSPGRAASRTRSGRGASTRRISPPRRCCRFYAGRLPAVEINNTFYRMPKPALLSTLGRAGPARVPVRAQGLAADHAPQAPEGSRASEVAYFFQTASTLGDRLGPALFQLPPNLKKDLPRLEAFLAVLPAGARAAFEFRHASWFEDDVFEALRGRGRGALHRRGRGARDAPRRDRGLGLPAPAAAGLRRRGGRRVGGEGPGPGVERGLRLLQARGRGSRAAPGGEAARALRLVSSSIALSPGGERAG